jgi:hypothetical protein
MTPAGSSPADNLSKELATGLWRQSQSGSLEQEPRRSGMFSHAWLTLLSMLFVSAGPAFGQQDYVSQYGAFVGYMFLDSPHVSLFENGVQAQIGVNLRT